MNRSIDPAKYSPNVANQLRIALFYKDYDNWPLSEKSFIDHFLRLFMTSCECKALCHDSFPFDKAVEIYREYYREGHKTMIDNDKRFKIGTVLKTMIVSSQDPRNREERIN